MVCFLCSQWLARCEEGAFFEKSEKSLGSLGLSKIHSRSEPGICLFELTYLHNLGSTGLLKRLGFKITEVRSPQRPGGTKSKTTQKT